MQLVILLLAMASLFAKETVALPFKTQEDVEFLSTNEDQFVGLTKTSDFIGVLTRKEKRDPVSKHVDVYEFKSQKEIKLELALCSSLAERVFGKSDSISLKASAPELRDSRSKGKICVVSYWDPGAKPKIKDRYLFLTVSKLKTWGFVFKFSKAPSATEVEEAFKFVDDIR